jgi:hypothetical protein
MIFNFLQVVAIVRLCWGMCGRDIEELLIRGSGDTIRP